MFDVGKFVFPKLRTREMSSVPSFKTCEAVFLINLNRFNKFIPAELDMWSEITSATGLQVFPCRLIGQNGWERSGCLMRGFLSNGPFPTCNAHYILHFQLATFDQGFLSAPYYLTKLEKKK